MRRRGTVQGKTEALTHCHKYIPIDNIIGIIKNMTTTLEPLFPIPLSPDPFDGIVDIEISTQGVHPTLGLKLEDNTALGDRL